MLNDRPVACQIREPTDPQGDRWHGEAVTDEVSPRSGVKLPSPWGEGVSEAVTDEVLPPSPPAGGTPNTLAASVATCRSRPRGGFGAI